MEKNGKFILMSLLEFRAWLIGNSFKRTVSVIQNHHTFLPNYSHFNGSNHFAKLTGMEEAHIKRGFPEIGQNLTIFPDGKVAVCRSLEKNPTCIADKNTGGLCIENLGDFDTGKDNMTNEQKQAIISVNALLCIKFNLNVDGYHVVYHHWFSDKSCPGTNFFGGNTRQSASDNFYPLIKKRIAEYNDGTFVLNGKITTDGLNIRTGPGTEYNILRTMNTNDTVSIYETRNNWHRISTGNEWVSGKFVEIT